MLPQLQQYLRTAASRGRTTTQVGPFLVTVDEGTTFPFLNYAVPDDGAEPSAEAVAALVAAYSGRDRIPRLEYLERSAPLVLPALEAAGFAVEGRLRAMTATAAAAPPLPDGYVIGLPGEDLEALLAVQNTAYGADDPVPDAAQVERSHASVAAGGILLAVRDPAGAVVGGGAATPSGGSGFTEVAGIAVAEAHRRRGIASAPTAELTRRALAAGVQTAFLTPADDGAARAYERAGFEDAGHMLHVRLM